VAMSSLTDGLAIESVSLTEPQVEMDLAEDGTVSFVSLFAPEPVDEAEVTEGPDPDSAVGPDPDTADSAPESAGDEEGDGFALSIDSVGIEQGMFVFRDHAVGQGFERTINDLNLTFEGFSLGLDREIKGTLMASGNDGMQLMARLKMVPAQDAHDIHFSLAAKELFLPDLSPYSVRFIAYPLAGGRLNLTQDIGIEGKDLSATVDIDIEDMELGKRTDNPDAVKLPLKLALAVLRDREGDIDLPLIEIEGRLDDPEFSVGRLVWYAVKNIITKAATAPFSILAGIIGSERNLEEALFVPGTAEFHLGESAKLGDLAKALGERPGLSLVIHPSYNVKEEELAMKRAVLNRELAALQTALPGSQSGTSAAAPASRRELVRAYFTGIFGPPRPAPDGTEQSAEELEGQLINTIIVPQSAWQELAGQRGDAARKTLVTEHSVVADRITVAENDAGEKDRGICGVRFSVK